MYKFVRCTKLHSSSGRAKYITNPKVQEEVVLKSEPVDWNPYHNYEMTHQKTSTKNNDGRELIVALPNEWYNLQEPELKEKAETIVKMAIGKTTDVQWAIHWNHARTNFHIHIIFSERTRIPENERKVWDRDVYLTADGKVARRKADRARDKDGNVLPPIHCKGEKQGEFTAKNGVYTQKKWLNQTKEQLVALYREWGITIDEQGVLHQYHEGKGNEAPAIKEKNRAIKEINDNFLKLLNNPKTKQKDIDKFKQEAYKAVKTGNMAITPILSGEPQRNAFERLYDGFTDIQAKRAARKAAEEQKRQAEAAAKKAAEEAARKIAEEKAAAAAELKLKFIRTLNLPLSRFGTIERKMKHIDFIVNVYKENSKFAGDTDLQELAYEKLVEFGGLSRKTYNSEFGFLIDRKSFTDVQPYELTDAIQKINTKLKEQERAEWLRSRQTSMSKALNNIKEAPKKQIEHSIESKIKTKSNDREK